MGADLTIVKNGQYFRDSYNPTNILWKLGMYYWNIDRGEDANVGKPRGGRLGARNVKKLYTEVIRREPTLRNFLESGLNEEWFEKNHFPSDDRDVEEWKKYFGDKYVKFVEFLKTAVKLRSGIEWSV